MSETGPETTESFASWMARIPRGDEDAARRFVEAFSDRLLGLAERRLDRGVRRRVEPADVLQSVFRTFFRRQAEGSIKPDDPARLWGLLARITVCKCLNAASHHRRHQRDPARELPIAAVNEPVNLAEPPAEAIAIARDSLEHAQRGLDTRDREIVALALIGEPPEKIADRVGCSRSTVFRVLAILRRRLEEALANE